MNSRDSGSYTGPVESRIGIGILLILEMSRLPRVSAFSRRRSILAMFPKVASVVEMTAKILGMSKTFPNQNLPGQEGGGWWVHDDELLRIRRSSF